MSEQNARFVGIVLAIVATAIVNRVLADAHIRAIEDAVLALIKKLREDGGLPPETAQRMLDEAQDEVHNGHR